MPSSRSIVTMTVALSLQSPQPRDSVSAQRRGRKPGESLGPSQRLVKSPDALRKKLETLRALPGFSIAVAMDHAGQYLTGYSSRAMDSAVWAQTSAPIFESIIDCSLRMDIGQFKRGIFEGESGLIYLIAFDEVRIAIFCDPPAKRDRVEDAVIKFVEDELYR